MSSAVLPRHLRRSLLEWLTLALVLLCVGGNLAYELYQDHVRLDLRERERLPQQANAVAESMGRQLSSINRGLLGVINEMPRWRTEKDGPQLATQHLKALTDVMTSVVTLLIVDANGIVVAANTPELVGRNVAQREYFKIVQHDPDAATLYVSPPFMTALGRFTMNLSRMVPAPNGRFGGIVVAGLNPLDFKSLLDSVLYRPETRAALIHGDGVPFLTAPLGNNAHSADPGKPDALFLQHRESGRRMSIFQAAAMDGGSERLLAMQTIQPPELFMDKPLVVVVERALPAVFSLWRKDANRNAREFALAALFGVAGLIFFQRRRRSAEQISASHEAERQRSIEALHQSEDRFRNLTNLSSDWYWEQDAQFRFVRLHGSLDPRAKEVNAAHMGKTRWEMGALNLNAADWDKHRAVLKAQREFHDFEMLRNDNKGRPYWLAISGMPKFDKHGVFCGYRGIARDISEKKFAEEKIRHMAFHDNLTQLPNRRLFNDRLEHAVAASKRHELHGAVMFLDLDNFKLLNATHGHEAGDLLLSEVAKRIVDAVRAVDTVARLGSDEFAIILDRLDTSAATSRQRAEIVAEKIRLAIAEPYVITLDRGTGTEVSVVHCCTISIGIVLFSGRETTLKEILGRADAAMYQAKRAGRNAARFYDPEDNAAGAMI